jgi:glycosidase
MQPVERGSMPTQGLPMMPTMGKSAKTPQPKLQPTRAEAVRAAKATGEPWLPLGNDYVHENVANLSTESRSVLNLYRALIELRKATAELVAGSYATVATTGDLLAYRREYEGNAFLIVLNLGANPISVGSDAVWVCAATKV